MRRKKVPVKKYYFLMNKAAGEVCSTVSDRRKTVYSHFPPEILIDSNGAKLHTVGRLDADTTGLLLLTNDGKFSDYLTRPQNIIEKTYLVKLKHAVTYDQQKNYIKKAAEGLILPPEKKAGEEKGAPAQIEWIKCDNLCQTGDCRLYEDRSQNEPGTELCDKCTITVTEGKFHEVKRIFRALGNEVTALRRIKMAGIELDEDLAPGQWRELREEEISLYFEKDNEKQGERQVKNC